MRILYVCSAPAPGSATAAGSAAPGSAAAAGSTTAAGSGSTGPAPYSPLAPQALDYLGHQIDRVIVDDLARGRPSNPTTPSGRRTAANATPTTGPNDPYARTGTAPEPADVAVVDACLDLSLAPRIAGLLESAGLHLPIIVVLSEGGLATASAKWNVTDVMLTTAGPAEVEARLRLARDRFTAVGATAGGRLGADPGPSAIGSLPGGRNENGEPLVVVTGALRIDETSFTADLGGRGLDLTYREFSLLKFFAMHPERVFTRDEILLTVWGDDYYGGTRTVDVHVRRLRAKLGKDLENAIHTVRNVGYRFSPDAGGDGSDDTDSPDAPGPSDHPENHEEMSA